MPCHKYAPYEFRAERVGRYIRVAEPRGEHRALGRKQARELLRHGIYKLVAYARGARKRLRLHGYIFSARLAQCFFAAPVRDPQTGYFRSRAFKARAFHAVNFAAL